MVELYSGLHPPTGRRHIRALRSEKLGQLPYEGCNSRCRLPPYCLPPEPSSISVLRALVALAALSMASAWHAMVTPYPMGLPSLLLLSSSWRPDRPIRPDFAP